MSLGAYGFSTGNISISTVSACGGQVGGGAKTGGCGYAFLRCTALRVSVVSVFCSVATSECSLFPRGDNALGLQFLGVSRIEDF